MYNTKRDAFWMMNGKEHKCTHLKCWNRETLPAYLQQEQIWIASAAPPAVWLQLSLRTRRLFVLLDHPLSHISYAKVQTEFAPNCRHFFCGQTKWTLAEDAVPSTLSPCQRQLLCALQDGVR